MNRRKKLYLTASLIVSLGVLSFCTVVVSAQPVCPLDTLNPKKVRSLDHFRRIPVLNQGRIKPLGTYAQSFLLRLSGRRSYMEESALEWFARFLFAPRTTYDDKVFLINNPEILEAIRVQPEQRRRYSWNQLKDGYPKIKEIAEAVRDIDEQELSVVEREILRVYSNLFYYVRISGAFAYAFPHPDFDIDSAAVKESLGLPLEQDRFSFYDMFIVSDRIEAAAAGLSSKDHGQWSAQEQAVARIINAMFFWTEHYANAPLGIIPTVNHEDEQWVSPMDIIRLNIDRSAYLEEITQIRNMTLHYWNGSQLEFDIAAKSFIDSVTERLSPSEKEQVEAIGLELMYNRLNLFFWAKCLYLISFLCFLFNLVWQRNTFKRAALVLSVAGFVPHLVALIMRIVIMSRPPVSNLFETFIFVGLVSVLIGFIIEMVNKNQLGIAVSSICGFGFLLIASKFAMEGDTLQVLVAVLNSNFWLSTHVLTITIGYAGCSVAGIMGHIYILQALARPDDRKRLNVTLNNILGILGFGLTATFLGTALGGIWADQSWGRFWGWDPKENGALLIVLWVAIIFHARLAKLIHPLGVAVASAMTLIVVMWAWFGVNLLSIGLHSYGFTSGIANALIIYVLLEVLFISVSVIILGRKKMKV